MINHFTFNGTSTAQLGLIVSGVSIFGAGSRKVEKAGIPGRNGDLQIELGGFNNYTVRYTVSITKNFTTTAQQIREWLLESKGYCDLTDTYHPDEIRKACFNSDIEFTTSMLYKYGQATIQFDCLPERYLTTNTPITTTATADTTTDTTLSLSTVPTPLNISLNGNTTQEGTPTPTNPQPIHSVSGYNEIVITGKNLLPYPETWEKGFFSSTGEIMLTEGNEERYNPLYIPTSESITMQTWLSSTPPAYMWYGVCFYDENKNFISRKAVGGADGQWLTTYQKTTFTLPTNAKYFRVSFRSFNLTSRLQIEYGALATSYEYTTQSYPLYLPVENLLDSDLLLQASGWAETDGVYSGLNSTLHAKWGTNTDGIYNTFEQGQQYTFSFDLRQDSTGFGALVIRFYYTDNTYDRKQIDGTSEWKRYTFTSTSTTKTLSKLILSYGNNLTIQLKNIQLEKGTNASLYNPYGNPYIELNKIGTYQDYIYKNGGKWYVYKEFNKVDLGTLTWTKTTSSTITVGYYFNAQITDFATSSTGWLCENYPNPQTVGLSNVVARYGAGVDKMGFTASSTLFYVIDSTYTDARTFKTAVNGVELVYRKRTATNTEITDTTLINQLNNIEKAYSYNGTTNILQVSNDNGFMLGVVSLHGSTFNSNYKGEPIITVNSTGLIYLNGEVMEVLSAPVTINCQTMQCYNGVVNMNNEVRVNDFPEIKIGENTVGSSMALTITPNNWRH